MDVSRKKIAAEVEAEMEGLDVTPERKKEIVERRLRNEINRGVQHSLWRRREQRLLRYPQRKPQQPQYRNCRMLAGTLYRTKL